MPQYLISVWHAEGDPQPPEDEIEDMFSAVDEFNEELRTSGAWVFAGGLHPPSTATVVDGTGSEVVTTDGPYSAADEQIGGFWVVEVPDLDAAIDLAARGSSACRARVEVRPFQDE